MNEPVLIQEYTDLIRRYVNNELSAAEFSHQYLSKFKKERAGLSEETFDILQQMFGEADAYCEDPDRRGEWEIGEKELRQTAIETVERLEQRFEELEQ